MSERGKKHEREKVGTRRLGKKEGREAGKVGKMRWEKNIWSEMSSIYFSNPYLLPIWSQESC